MTFLRIIAALTVGIVAGVAIWTVLLFVATWLGFLGWGFGLMLPVFIIGACWVLWGVWVKGVPFWDRLDG